MNKYNTKLGQLLDIIPRSEFRKLVKETESDKSCKGFNTWTQLVSMIFAQITNVTGLRSIEKALNSNAKSLYHLGISKQLARSTISYANNHRLPKVFEKLFYLLLGKVERKANKLLKNALYAIDATTISLNINDFSWAKFRTTKSGVKINTKYDINNSVPDFLFITNANEHENNTLSSMKLKEGDTVVFDKGYCNYKQFGDFCKQNIYFVTRLKNNAAYKVIKENKIEDKTILIDEIIEFTGEAVKKNCPSQLRRIRVLDEKTSEAITILTNIFDENAVYIGKLYRARWNIEIFFKTIKQNLRIKKFYGQSENAVKTQIWIALIVYILYLLLKQQCTKNGKIFTHFICELSVCLFERTDILDWFCGQSSSLNSSKIKSFHYNLQLNLSI